MRLTDEWLTDKCDSLMNETYWWMTHWWMRLTDEWLTDECDLMMNVTYW